MPNETTDRRAMLREAYAEAASDEPETPELEVEEPAAPEPEALAPEADAEPAAEAAAEAAAPEGETAEQRAERVRDEGGRYAKAPKEGKDAKPKAAPAKPAAAPALVKPAAAAAPPKPALAQPAKPAEAPATPAAPSVRPPQSWTPAEREAWAKTPPEAQKAILRREQEVTRVVQENATLRKEHGDATKFKGEVEGWARGYEGIFRAQGMNPMQGIASVVDTYAALHLAPAPQKAAILAQLIGQFSNVDDVNQALQGAPAQPQQAPQYRPPQREAPVDVRAVLREELQAMTQKAALSRAERDLEAFQSAAPEFLDAPGVWESMQTVLDSSAQRGRNLTYQQAYDLAVKMDPEIQAILEQRAKAAAVTQPSALAPTARARTAAATVRSRPASSVGAEVDPKDRRAMLQRALERR